MSELRQLRYFVAFITHHPGSAVREIILDACAEAGFRPRATVLDIGPPPITRTSVLVWPARRTLGPAATAFVAFTRDHLELLQD